MKKLLVLLSLTLLFANIISAQTTTVWIVRHAEKDKSNPQDTNPNLSDEGRVRAGFSNLPKKGKI